MEVAVAKTSLVPSGSDGDQFITDSKGIHYLCRSIPQTACPIAGTTYFLKNGVGHAPERARGGLLATAIKQKWPGQNNLYLVTLSSRAMRRPRTRPASTRTCKLAEMLVEKASATHVKGVLSQLEKIGRPAFDASVEERQRFQFANPVEVDGTKISSLPDGSTVLLVVAMRARAFRATCRSLQRRSCGPSSLGCDPSIAIVPIAFSKTIKSRTLARWPAHAQPC